MFNNEPELQKLYKTQKEETSQAQKVPKDVSLDNKDDTVKYEVGKTVSTGAFNIKVGEKINLITLWF